MKIRQRIEEMEAEQLSEYACLSKNSKGRANPYRECEVRTCFQRDRDRIIHSKAFRRLRHKTQVFIAPAGDHYRTRMTHTLEVAQIARTIAKALKLNEDLTEAIALGHDLGHTAFGHAGEQALDQELQKHFGMCFRHNEQSLRVVEVLEPMNLTWEVRNGILHHTGAEKPDTLEGQIVKTADRIAYINHDIDDAVRGGVIKNSELPKDAIKILGEDHSTRINRMVMDMITSSWNRNEILLSDEIKFAMDRLRIFLFERVYVGSEAKKEEEKAKKVLVALLLHFVEHPDSLPAEWDSLKGGTDNIARIACDYVAGMTDRYAISKYTEVFLPDPWLM